MKSLLFTLSFFLTVTQTQAGVSSEKITQSLEQCLREGISHQADPSGVVRFTNEVGVLCQGDTAKNMFEQLEPLSEVSPFKDGGLEYKKVDFGTGSKEQRHRSHCFVEVGTDDHMCFIRLDLNKAVRDEMTKYLEQD